MTYIRKLFTDSEIDEIAELLPNTKWENGQVSGGGIRKKNLQAIPDCPVLAAIDELTYRALEKDSKFFDLTFAYQTNRIIVSKTEVGGFYKPHIDEAILGHYSTTVFLNDDYSGGELELYENGESKKYKPQKGYAITYKSGIPHCVNAVTSGSRYAAVTWSTSGIKDEYIRSITSEIKRAIQACPLDDIETMEDFINSPREILENILQNIYRKYGRYGK